MNSDQNIAVIGAGISGLSVSCGLMALGAKVYLYEKASDEIHLQRGNTTRFIHPNISNWPSIEYAYPYTHLPFLNWRSGTAGDITTQILEQWDVFLKRHKSQLKWNPNQNIERISGSGNKLFLHLNGEVHGSFEKVVIAAGYGLERKNFGNAPSYWRNDDLDQPILDKNEKKRILVSGTGDGGLTEVLRLTVKDFYHQKFMQSVMHNEALRDFANRFEKRLKKAPKGAWKEFFDSECDKWKIDSPAFNLRDDTQVCLNARKPYPSKADAQIIHRLLVAFLIRDEVIEYVDGDLVKVYQESKEENYLVEFKRGKESFFKEFDELVQRHNTIPVFQSLFEDGSKVREVENKKWDEEPDLRWTAVDHPGFLSNEFKKSNFEDRYDLGVKLDSDDTETWRKKAIEIATRLYGSRRPKTLADWLSNNRVPPSELEECTFEWKENSKFRLCVEKAPILRHGGEDPPKSNISSRRFSPSEVKCLFLKTSDRALLEHLLRDDKFQYHILRIYPTRNVPNIPSEPYVNTHTNVFLLTRGRTEADKNFRPQFFEIQSWEGLYQAHRLLRIPTLLQIMGNKWPTQRVHGIGWAVGTTYEEIRKTSHSNKLLEWEPM
ncbi:MAG: hypothetical protein H6677_17025 [Candidatus Obscuribacterales bacterium]|nr:hypothetical protein [Candidatus Obscuribacterales bacterium]